MESYGHRCPDGTGHIKKKIFVYPSFVFIYNTWLYGIILIHPETTIMWSLFIYDAVVFYYALPSLLKKNEGLTDSYSIGYKITKNRSLTEI